jgi:hypothetical protein
MKVVDVDQILKDEAVTIKLHGKEFIVTDIDEDLLTVFDDPKTPKKEIVKKILGCADEDLVGCGLLTFATIISQVTRNFTQRASLNDLLEGSKPLEP